MPPRQAGSWARLGDLLARRRVELDPRYKNRTLFAGERGLNWRLLHDIERAKRANFDPDTLAAIEVAYDLAPGSIGRALGGGDLEPLAVAPPPPETAQAPRHAPAARPELDFSGGDRTGHHPWRQQVLREAYASVGLADRFGPGDVPEPSEIPGAEAMLAMMPESRRPFRAVPLEAETWDDENLTLNERLDWIAATRRMAAAVDQREDRRTGLAVS